jgi:dCMP deaminase
MTRPDWDPYFLDIARAVAARADCTRRQVGAVLVRDHRIVSTGYNGAPAGQPGCLTAGACPRGRTSYEEVPAFSDYTAAAGAGACIAHHAEANALYYARFGSTFGADLYITCEPCPQCQTLITRLDVARVVWPDGEWIPGTPWSPLAGAKA